MKTFLSALSHTEFPVSDKISGKMIRQSLFEFIKSQHPEFTKTDFISLSELNFYREKYIADTLVKEINELTDLESEVLTSSLAEETTITDKIELQENTPTKGQIIADKVAYFGGSWKFILIFAGFLVLWIAINIFWFSNRGFDPYPFILLNLILSCIAALQAPVIMMSQNRQEEKDRERAKKDYLINLKSELEIRILHEKIDHLIMHQQQELLEIQRIQIDMMNDILEKINSSHK